MQQLLRPPRNLVRRMRRSGPPTPPPTPFICDDGKPFLTSYPIAGPDPKRKGMSKCIQINNDVHRFLKSNYFSDDQIWKIATRSPSQLLQYSALKTAWPNLEFLRSKGLSAPKTAEVISSCPTLLTVSLDSQIIPAYNALQNIFRSDSNTAVVVANCPKLLLKKNVRPLLARSINILRGYGGVPLLDILKLLTASPWIIATTEHKLKTQIKWLRAEMGFDPSTQMFHEALGAVMGLTRSQWERKLNLLNKWGVSKDQVIASFRLFPKLMSIPSEKINGVMELLVNWLGMEPSLIIVTYPTLLVHSVSKRFIPRVCVLMHLIFHEKIKKKDITPVMFMITDKCFLRMYVPQDFQELLSLFPKGIRESASEEELM